MKRRMAMALVVVCLMLSMPTISYAAEENSVAHINATNGIGGIEPYYVNTANLSASFRIDENTDYCYAEVAAKKACRIQVILQIEHKEEGVWVNKISWVETSVSAGGKTISKTHSLIERGSYRVNAIFTVGGETVSCTSVTKTY